MFENKKFHEIDIRQLKIDSKPLGEGGFGAVYKSVFLMVSSTLHNSYGCIEM